MAKTILIIVFMTACLLAVRYINKKPTDQAAATGEAEEKNQAGEDLRESETGEQ